MVVHILLCQSIINEMKKIVKQAYKLRRLSPVHKVQEVNEFIAYSLLNNFPEFSAAGFLTIRRSTIFSILGTVTTFLIIMVQFNTCGE